jgi:cell wall-associated NlpC family hydrolase
MSKRNAATIIAVAAALAMLMVPAAGAAPTGDLEAQAKALEAQIADNGTKIAALGEKLNAAQLALDDALAKIADADARTAVAKAETARLEALVRDRAAAIYRGGGASGSIDIFDLSNVAETNAREKYGEVATRRDNSLLTDLDAARADLAVQRHTADTARQAAQTEKDALSAAKAEADAAAAAQQALLDQVQGQLADLVRQEQARREAAAASAAPGRTSTKWNGPVPNPSGGAGAAVAFARAQIGKPYEYAASGPDTYDCSGLTMRAWQAGGLSLPHYSGAQAAMFPKVPLDQLQPGDLITTSSWGAHIGIWAGGGYIHATHTGDVIKYVAGSGSVRDAVRPG